MATVYIVTSGSYSDYGINRVFSTREKAESWAGPLGYEIEEWELDDSSDPLVVVTRVSGQIINGKCEARYDHLRESSCNLNCVRVNKDWKTGVPIMHFDVATADPQEALKIFSEKRAQFLAQSTSCLEIKNGLYNRDTLAWEAGNF